MAKVASSASMSSYVLSFPNRINGRPVSLALVAHGKLLSPAQLRTQIKRLIEIIKAAAWFFAERSPGIKRQREVPPPPLGYIFAEYPLCVPVRVMFRCVATACRRLVTAPAGVQVMYRTTGRWAAWIMERVMRGRVRRVQVRLQRRACCAVRCACRASACVRCVFDACCRKRWLVFKCVCCTSQRLHQARRGVHSCVQAAAAARVAGGRDIVELAYNGDGASVLCHLILDADRVNKRGE